MQGPAGRLRRALLFGEELGLGPTRSLRGHTLSIAGSRCPPRRCAHISLAARHEVWVYELTLTLTRSTIRGRRRGPHVVQRTWAMYDAKRAGLAAQNAWRTYPRAT